MASQHIQEIDLGACHLSKAPARQDPSSRARIPARTAADALPWRVCAQVRKLHDISTASVLGTVAMMGALVVTAVQLCAQDVAQHPKTHLVAPMTADRIPQIFVAILDAVFAFGGQENWVR